MLNGMAFKPFAKTFLLRKQLSKKIILFKQKVIFTKKEREGNEWNQISAKADRSELKENEFDVIRFFSMKLHRIVTTVAP